MKIVLKIGGNEIDDPAFLDKVVGLVRRIRQEKHSLVLVHGGGKEITAMLDALGLEARFVNGLRYTDEKIVGVVEMVLSGIINKRLVRSLQTGGVAAIGLSGVDGGIMKADRIERNGKDIGLVGEVSAVNTTALAELMEKFAVVLSPISLERDSGNILNVNADYAASAVAASISSDLIIFLSNVPGVIQDGRTLPTLNQSGFDELRKNGIVSGGMVPKVEAAIKAIARGAGMAYITDAEGAADLFRRKNAGTRVTL